MTFDQLGLSAPLVKAVAAEGYTKPTPIQAQAIPHVLAGRDVLGCAQTGTGKTAAFALPTLQRLAAKPAPVKGAVRVLVVTPTRELATQVGDSFGTYGRGTGLRHTVIFGGVGQNDQVQALRRGVEILVATPGRLLDLMQQGFVTLKHIEVLVLDEADRMLDMGFIHDIKKILAVLPRERQTLFFSATMPQEVQSLVNSILRNPVRVEVTPVASTAEKVDQCVYFVEKAEKRKLLAELLRDAATVKRAIVFTRTKHGANRVARDLNNSGIQTDVIHGNKSQNARERALDGFKAGSIRVLVATDIAARGIDVDDISHVINFELPNIPETYVHRIGRTARAGATGKALSLCEHEERAYLRDIERLIKQAVPVAEHPTYKSNVPMNARPPAAQPQQQQRNQHRHGGQQRQGQGQGRGHRHGRRGGGGGGGGGQRSAQGAQGQSSAPAAPSRKPMPKWY